MLGLAEFVPTKLINARLATGANKTYPKRIKSAMARKHCHGVDYKRTQTAAQHVTNTARLKAGAVF